MKRGQCVHPQYAQVNDECTLCGFVQPGIALDRMAKEKELEELRLDAELRKKEDEAGWINNIVCGF